MNGLSKLARKYRLALEEIAEERQTLYRDQQATQPIQALTPAAIIAVRALGWGWDWDKAELIKTPVEHGSKQEASEKGSPRG